MRNFRYFYGRDERYSCHDSSESHGTMKLAKLLPALCVSLVACVSQPVSRHIDVEALLSGRALFGETIDVSNIEADNILATSEEMREYVASRVGDNPHARSRLRILIKSMIDDGLLTLDYDPNLTYTAVETFQRRQGNCLSFSILFAALAREANLDLTFQMVEIPPSFQSDGGMVILNNHINVLVKGVRQDVNFTGDYVVDFNTAEYNGNYDTRKVDDNYAIALYFSNVAVEALQRRDTRQAFRYLKKGIATDPEIAGLWVNLGVLYSRNEHLDLAIGAYQQALTLQPSNKSALVNMASVMHRQGRTDEAAYYSGRVDYYRSRNPYYHYHLAQAAFREGRYEETLSHLSKAVSLKDDEHQFYFLRGLVHQQRNEIDLAEREYKKARDTAEKAQLVSGYNRKLEMLDSRLN